jgi:hypothetical protein
MTVITSPHFIPAFRLPVQDTSTAISVAYEMLGERGGLIAEAAGVPLYYITAPFLWASITAYSETSGLAAASVLPLSVYLHISLNDKHPMREKIAKLSLSDYLQESDPGYSEIRNVIDGNAPLVAAITPWDIRADSDETTVNDEQEVTGVRDAAGRFSGWYFSSRPVLESVQTPRPVFKCKRYQHPNPGPDSNKCRICRGPIY